VCLELASRATSDEHRLVGLKRRERKKTRRADTIFSRKLPLFPFLICFAGHIYNEFPPYLEEHVV
jgi:hypothetical protein